MTKKINPSWIKRGEVRNPNGKPKGSLHPNSLKKKEIVDKACENMGEAYRMLWTAMQSNEAWAYQIYFKELCPIPKKMREETLQLDIDNSGKSDITTYIQGLIEMLSQMKEYTHDEAMETLKTLSNVKVADLLTKVANQSQESREDLWKKLELMKNAMDAVKKE